MKEFFLKVVCTTISHATLTTPPLLYTDRRSEWILQCIFILFSLLLHPFTSLILYSETLFFLYPFYFSFVYKYIQMHRVYTSPIFPHLVQKTNTLWSFHEWLHSHRLTPHHTCKVSCVFILYSFLIFLFLLFLNPHFFFSIILYTYIHIYSSSSFSLYKYKFCFFFLFFTSKNFLRWVTHKSFIVNAVCGNGL